MYKNLFTIFGYTVQTHAVISLIAIILAMGVAYGLTRNTHYQGHIADFIIWAVIGAIIGARFWHVFIFQWPTYSKYPGQIIQIWNGGISILGAIVGGAIALYFYCRKHKLDFLDLADYLAPSLILGMGIGRIACYMAGDAFGIPTHSDFGTVFPKGTIAYDTFGSQPLWPAIAWEIQGDFVIFAILYFLLYKKLSKGIIFSLFFVFYGALRFTLGFVRGDSPKLALGMNGGQWTTMFFVILGIISVIVIILMRGLYKKDNTENAATVVE